MKARAKQRHPVVHMKGDSDGIFIIVDGVKVATRGDAKTWIPLEPGFVVRDVNYPDQIEIERHGFRIH